VKAKTKKTVSKKTETKKTEVKPIKVPDTMHALRTGALRALGIDPRNKEALRQVIAGGPQYARANVKIVSTPINGRRANVVELANGKKAA
jgi:hypothetical protein